MLRMLADGTRLRLMWLLATGEYDVSALTDAVGVARPGVSQHLGKLRLAGLVTMRRQGRRAVYTVGGGHVRRLVMEALQAAEHQLYDIPHHHGGDESAGSSDREEVTPSETGARRRRR